MAGKRVVFFAMHRVNNKPARRLLLGFLVGFSGVLYGLLSVAVVSQMAAKNALFYSVITILTYFSTFLYTI